MYFTWLKIFVWTCMWIAYIDTTNGSLTYEIGQSTLDMIANETSISYGRESTELNCDNSHARKCFNTSGILDNVGNPYIGGNMIIIGNNGCTIGSVFETLDCDKASHKPCQKVGITNGYCYV